MTRAEAERAAREALEAFVNGPPARGIRTDGWATTDDYRVCGYCQAKSAHGDTPLAHYDECAFVKARAALAALDRDAGAGAVEKARREFAVKCATVAIHDAMGDTSGYWGGCKGDAAREAWARGYAEVAVREVERAYSPRTGEKCGVVGCARLHAPGRWYADHNDMGDAEAASPDARESE